MPPAAHVSYPAEGVGMILIDNPPKNFASWALIERIEQALFTIKESGARVVILASDVPGYFIAHADLDDLISLRTGGQPSGDFGAWGRIGRELLRGPMISIASNHGQAWGGGSELSWCCNLRIAGESATYGQPEVALGVIAGGGGTTRLARLVGEARCMEIILDGRPVTAQQAYLFGACNRVVPDDKLREETIAWAARLARRPAWASMAAKKSLLEGLAMSARDAAKNEGEITMSLRTEPRILPILQAAKAKYDAGADSWEALEL